MAETVISELTLRDGAHAVTFRISEPTPGVLVELTVANMKIHARKVKPEDVRRLYAWLGRVMAMPDHNARPKGSPE